MRVGYVGLMVFALAAALYGQEKALPTVGKLKNLCLTTPIVTDGAPAAVIAVPDDDRYRKLAEAINEHVKQLAGVTLPMKGDSEVADGLPAALVPTTENRKPTTVVVPGNLMSNKVAAKLYCAGYVASDAAWPGPGGYELRTVHNPFGNGQNFVMAGGSSFEGVEAATKRLVELLKGGKTIALPPLVDIRLPKPPARLNAEQVAKIVKPLSETTMYGSAGGEAQRYGRMFFETGFPEFAVVFKGAMAALERISDGMKVLDDLRSTTDLPLIWDTIEESPAFMDADRLRITNFLYRYALKVPYATAGVSPSKQPHGNNWNAHGTFAVAQYFAKYYHGLDIGKSLMAKMKIYYDSDIPHWKPSENCPGYGDLTIRQLLFYVIHAPDFRFIENGNLRRIADYDIAIVDNAGVVAGFGDSGSYKYLTSVFPTAAWAYRDGRYLFMYEKAGGKGGRFCVDDVKPTEPTDMLGVKVVELPQWVYDRRGPRTMPYERTFDKISFRAGFDAAKDHYLLLGGMGYGFHSHPDANGIHRFSQNGKAWLFDDGYMIPEMNEHNTIQVYRDGRAKPLPELSELQARADFPGMGFVRSAVSDYNGVDWARNIVWNKNRWFLVLDELVAREAGEYGFQCFWRTQGEVELRGAELVATQDEDQFHILNADGAAMSLKDCHGPRNARALYQAASRKLRKAERKVLANLFYATVGKERRDIEMLSAAENVVLVKDGNDIALVGVGRIENVAGLTADAKFVYASANAFRLVGENSPTLGQVSADFDFVKGEAMVEASKAGTMTLFGQRVEVKAGRQSLNLPKAGPDPVLAKALGETYTALAKKREAAAAAPSAQGLERLWAYWDFEVLANFAPRKTTTVRASLAPLTPADVNFPIGVLDAVRDANGNVMFPTGKSVTLTFDLGSERVIHAATANARQLVTFQGGCGISKVTVTVSNDDFKKDIRPFAQRAITDKLQNAMAPYDVPGPPQKARFVRCDFQPYSADHKVYLDSVQIIGPVPREEMKLRQFRINGLATCDLNGDGQDESIVGATANAVHALSADGKRLWKQPVGGAALAIAAADIDKDGKGEVLVGSADQNLYCFDGQGKLRWKQQPPARTFARPGYWSHPARTGEVKIVFTADLDGDGFREILCGVSNWFTYCYDHTGKLLWSECNWAHQPTCGVAMDLDGDGKKEVAMGNTYGSAQVYSSAGKLIGAIGMTGHAGPTAMDVAKMADKAEFVVGDRAGLLKFLQWPKTEVATHQFGCAIACVAIADLGDGKPVALVGSRNYYLYAFDLDGKQLWLKHLGDVPRQIVVADLDGDGQPEVACACEDGLIRVLDSKGAEQASFRASAPFRHLAVGALRGGKAKQLVAVSDDGVALALRASN